MPGKGSLSVRLRTVARFARVETHLASEEPESTRSSAEDAQSVDAPHSGSQCIPLLD